MAGPRLRSWAVTDFLAEAIIERTHASPARLLVGLTGGPGAGKSTVAEALASKLNTAGIPSAVLPMDGFHMRQDKLLRLGLDGEKGAPHTFEAQAFVDFLALVKAAETPVSGPVYTRDIEDVTQDGYIIETGVKVVIVEGNYLLFDDVPWNGIRNLLDLAVYLHVPKEIVKQRLLKRHGEHGRFSVDHIARHVDAVDLLNYELVAATAKNADLTITIDTRT